MATGLALAAMAAGAHAEEIRPNEALVLRLAFGECLTYLRTGRTPFLGLPTQPAAEPVKRQFPAAMPDRNQIVQLLSARYAAAWGGDANGRHCIVRTVLDPWPPPSPGLLGVDPVGFVERVTARATPLGLTVHPGPDETFSPLHVTTWSEPDTGAETGPRRPIRIVIMPGASSADGSLMDAGTIVMSGPP